MALLFVLLVLPASAHDKLPLVKVVATGGTIASTPSGRLQHLARQLAHPRAQGERDPGEGAGGEGIVVTHGSNTVEETGYFLSLTVKTDKPIVLTAAQRQFTTLRSDSPKNLM